MIKQNRFYNTLLNPLYEGCDLNDPVSYTHLTLPTILLV